MLVKISAFTNYSWSFVLHALESPKRHFCLKRELYVTAPAA